MKIRNFILLSQVLMPILFSGCASQYKYSDTANSASLVLSGNSKHFYVEAYENEQCVSSRYGQRLATFFGPGANVKNHQDGAEFTIPAGKKFLISGIYLDAQLAKNRRCTITAGFIPQVGKRYRAHFITNEDITSCRYEISLLSSEGVTKEPSAFIPQALCFEGKSLGAINRPDGVTDEIYHNVRVTDKYGNPL